MNLFAISSFPIIDEISSDLLSHIIRNKKNCFHAIMLFHPQLHGSNVKGNQYRTTTILHIIWHYMCTANMYFLCKDYKFPLCPNFQCTGNPLIVWPLEPRKNLTNGNSYYHRSFYGINW